MNMHRFAMLYWLEGMVSDLFYLAGDAVEAGRNKQG